MAKRRNNICSWCGKETKDLDKERGLCEVCNKYERLSDMVMNEQIHKYFKIR